MLYLITNEQEYSVSIPYSLFIISSNRFYSLFVRIQNKESKNGCVPYFLFYKIDVTLERQLCKLRVSAENAAVFTPSSF